MAGTLCVALVSVGGFLIHANVGSDGSAAKDSPSIRALTSDEPGVVDVRWKSVIGAARYRVNASLDRSMVNPVTRDFTTLSGSLDGLDPGGQYFVTVEALGTDDELVRVPARRVVVLGPAPSDVKATQKGNTEVEVTWKKVDEVDTYLVRYAATEDMADAKTIDLNDAGSVRVKDLDPGSKLWVTVQAGDDPRATSEPVEVTLPDSTQVTFGTFNLFGVNNDSNRPGNARPWRDRRGVVVDEIMAAGLDVVGIQEANQSNTYGSRVDFGPNQMTDLRGSLQREAKAWQLVNDIPYNCARGDSSSGCSVRDRGASNGTRILYRSDRVTIVSSGSVRYGAQSASTKRYLAWAIMRPKDGGQEFFFATTHLQPGKSGADTSARRRQWQQLISETKARAAGRPVIVTGDFNTSPNQRPAEMFSAMHAAGFGDVLGLGAPGSRSDAVQAKKVVNGFINSYNDFARSLPGRTCYCSNQSRFGNSIDYIFASNNLTVPKFELVAPVNSAFQMVGTIPSDHNLLTAVIEVPAKK